MMEELLQFARELAGEAGDRLAALYGRAEAGTKEDGSVVTDADRAVDRYLARRIHHRYPGHAILSEESATLYDGRPVTWVIDPLDGTTNYALGICYWGCSIGVVVDGRPVIGVLTMPELDAEFWALAGAGAFLNGDRLGGPPRGVDARNSCLAICSRTWRYFDVAVRYKGRLLGSAAYDLAAVAEGLAVGCIQAASHVWDIAAGWVLLQEAGRPVRRLFPGAPDPFPMIAGTDYRGRIFPLAAAADEETLVGITGKVNVKRDVQDRWNAWAAAGWDLQAWRKRRG
jgi:myo-inositol-1(or 4)-monophosphatase